MINLFNSRLWPAIAVGSALTTLSIVQQTAQAATLIDFNDQAPGGFPTPLSTAGFQITGGSFISSGASFCAPEPECPENGSAYVNLLSEVGMGGMLHLTPAAGQTFSFLQFDGAEVEKDEVKQGGFTTGGQFWAKTIEVIGLKANGSEVTASFELDHIQDGSGPEDDFQTFALLGDFTNLVELSLKGTGGELASWFSVDNLLLEVIETPDPDPESVPEPALLLSIALVGSFGVLTRRR